MCARLRGILASDRGHSMPSRARSCNNMHLPYYECLDSRISLLNKVRNQGCIDFPCFLCAGRVALLAPRTSHNQDIFHDMSPSNFCTYSRSSFAILRLPSLGITTLIALASPPRLSTLPAALAHIVRRHISHCPKASCLQNWAFFSGVLE